MSKSMYLDLPKRPTIWSRGSTTLPCALKFVFTLQFFFSVKTAGGSVHYIVVI